MTKWELDYRLPEDPTEPIEVGQEELLNLIRVGLLVAREGGPWGATHYSNDYERWFKRM